MKALSFGEVLWDVIEGEEHLGGAPFNLAAHLARCGDEAYALTCVGDDPRGARVMAEMAALGVSDAYARIDPERPTGWVTVDLSEAGQPSYTIHEDVAWDHIVLPTELEATLCGEDFDVLCFGSLAQRCEGSAATLHRILDLLPETKKFFDVNLRQHYYSKACISTSLSHTDILKLNDDEVGVLGPLLFDKSLSETAFSARASEAYALEIVLITRGAKGCGLYYDGALTDVPGEAVTIADTVGAGDAFSAAFLHKYLNDADPITAAQTANHLGAYVASQRGAIPEYGEEILMKLKE
jgi:fructokinase